MSRIYTGIGSRAAPASALAAMGRYGERFARAGWTLRSGGAEGADLAFETGARKAEGRTAIYVPWRGFNGNKGGVVASSEQAAAAMAVASAFHPAWNRLSLPVRQLMGRNVFQVLGVSLDEPTEFVLCWAPIRKIEKNYQIRDVEGGTGLAVRLAVSRRIPVFHLDIPAHIAEVEHRLEASINVAANAPSEEDLSGLT